MRILPTGSSPANAKFRHPTNCRVAIAPILCVALVLVTQGCGGRPAPTAVQSAPRVLTLTWRDYHGNTHGGETSESALYILDGKVMGRGTDGLQAIFAVLSQEPPGSILKITWQDESPTSGYGIYSPPYQSYMDEFIQIVNQQHIKVESSAWFQER